ncbi:hypothetical protein ACLOJK_029281, partial [Asimina triloba]
ELPSQSESNLDKHCEAITLGNEKQGNDQQDYGDQMLEKEDVEETEAPNAVQFISQMEEAEKVKQELP